MAANYWESSQKRFWTFTKEQLREKRRKLDEEDRSSVQQYPLPSYRLLGIYIYQQIAKFGKRMALRQQVLATAHIYIKRYYTKVAIRRTNLYLLVATAVYLAGKMEESPSHIRLVLGEARQLFPDMILSDTSKIGECEFGLISELSSQLIVHHPYRSLSELQSQFPLSTEETALAWSIINDHYLTDLPLLHPPHVIAITAVFLAVVLKPSQGSQQPSAHQIAGALNTLKGDGQMPQSRATKLVNWLAETSVDIAAVVDCTQELISQYEVWEQYNEKVVKEQISRYVKGRGLDK